MRLFYLGPYNSPHLADLALAMRERGHVVEVCGSAWGGLPATQLPAEGVPVHELGRPAPLQLRRLLREFRPDVVHAHWLPFARLAVLAAARPLVATAWGSDLYHATRPQTLATRLALRRTAVAMADSEDLLKRVRALGPRSLRTMLVNWGTDLRMFRPPAGQERAALKERFELGTGPVVLSPRGLKEIYNPAIVDEAFNRVREKLPAAQLVLRYAGDNAPKDPPPGVHVVGWLEPAELAALYRAAEVTVSIPRSDSSPRSVWEAMASGSAMVVSDLPWAHELLVERRKRTGGRATTRARRGRNRTTARRRGSARAACGFREEPGRASPRPGGRARPP